MLAPELAAAAAAAAVAVLLALALALAARRKKCAASLLSREGYLIAPFDAYSATADRASPYDLCRAQSGRG